MELAKLVQEADSGSASDQRHDGDADQPMEDTSSLGRPEDSETASSLDQPDDPRDPDDGRPLHERAEGQMGPGIERHRGIDPTLLTAAIFVLLGYTPVSWWERFLVTGYFGPLEIPAVLAMVGVLFAFIAVLRAVDTNDVPLRTKALIAGAAGLARLFVVPFF